MANKSREYIEEAFKNNEAHKLVGKVYIPAEVTTKDKKLIKSQFPNAKIITEKGLKSHCEFDFLENLTSKELVRAKDKLDAYKQFKIIS
jgi:hypothetical protein